MKVNLNYKFKISLKIIVDKKLPIFVINILILKLREYKRFLLQLKMLIFD